MRRGITHGLVETSSVQLNASLGVNEVADIIEVRGHADQETALVWRDGNFTLRDRKQDVIESMPDALWKELLGYIRRGYGLRIIVSEPSHLPTE